MIQVFIELKTSKYKEIPLKFTRNKRNIMSEIMSQKYPTTTVKLGTNFEKSRLSSVILKIVEVNPQIDHNFKHIRNLSGQFLYIYIYIYNYI